MASDSKKKISGHIAGIGLPSFLQMIEAEQKTCTLRIFAEKKIGAIYFRSGRLIDSKTDNLTRLNALYDILSWDDIVIKIENRMTKQKDEINLPLMHILIEGARVADEKKSQEVPNDSKKIKASSPKNIHTKNINNENFCLEIGIRLLIDLENLAIPFQSTLIGMEHGKYLVLKAPDPIGSIDHELFNVDTIIVKSLYKGTIYAFQSKVMNTIKKPSKLMFIAYPQKIEHYELRMHKRFKCSIVTQTKVNEKNRGGVIENISKGGCQCIIETFESDSDQPPDLLNSTIPFRCYFPGSKGEVTFMGEIKNVRKKKDEIVAGIKFIDPHMNEDAQDVIQNYIRLIEYSSEYV